MARSPNYPPTEWVAYDAARARAVLEHNTANRKLRGTVVERYARDMAAGDWQATGDTIKIATDGTLIDGQHRLEAIVEAGDKLPAPVPILTVSDLDHSAVMPVTDTGLKRLPQDVLHLVGVPNASAVSAMVRGIIRIQTRRAFAGTGTRQLVSNSEMLGWIQDHPDAIPWLQRNVWTIRKTNMPLGSASPAFWILHDLDLWRGAEFLEGLATLEQLPRGSAIATLARTVNTLRAQRSRLEPIEWIGMTFEAFNAWQGDEEVRSLRPTKYPSGDRFPWPMMRAEALLKNEHAAIEREGQSTLV